MIPDGSGVKLGTDVDSTLSALAQARRKIGWPAGQSGRRHGVGLMSKRTLKISWRSLQSLDGQGNRTCFVLDLPIGTSTDRRNDDAVNGRRFGAHNGEPMETGIVRFEEQMGVGPTKAEA